MTQDEQQVALSQLSVHFKFQFPNHILHTLKIPLIYIFNIYNLSEIVQHLFTNAQKRKTYF